MPFWLGPISRFGPLLFTRFINGSHLLRMRNLPGLHAALRLAASSLTVTSDDVFPPWFFSAGSEIFFRYFKKSRLWVEMKSCL